MRIPVRSSDACSSLTGTHDAFFYSFSIFLVFSFPLISPACRLVFLFAVYLAGRLRMLGISCVFLLHSLSFSRESHAPSTPVSNSFMSVCVHPSSHPQTKLESRWPRNTCPPPSKEYQHQKMIDSNNISQAPKNKNHAKNKGRQGAKKGSKRPIHSHTNARLLFKQEGRQGNRNEAPHEKKG